jgi:hypothetical protein
MVNLSLGITPFFALFGKEMRTFSDFDQLNFPERFGEKHAITHFYTELSTMRDILKQNVQTSRDKTDQRHNEDVSNPIFKTGDLVYMKRENTPASGDLKHARQYLGPLVIIEKRTEVLCRLQFVYTGKIINHFVNICKLRSLKDNRDILKARLSPLPPAVGPVLTATCHSPEISLTPPEDEQNAVPMTSHQGEQPTLASNFQIDGPLDLSCGPPKNADVFISKSDEQLCNDITRICAVKIRSPFAMFKVFRADKLQPEWISSNFIPQDKIIAFYLQKHQKRLEKQYK